MLEPVPWFIGGEAEHSPEVARMLAYVASSGNNGISASTDLHVTATPVPTDHIRVMPGSAVLVNKYPGGEQQSYMVRNVSATDVYVPPTGSQSGSTRYLILRIDDPNYGGQAPADPTLGPYCSFQIVPSIANLFYPHIVLASITMPLSTGTVQPSHIKDLRKLAQPNTETVVIPRPSAVGETGLELTAATAYPKGELFPDSGSFYNIAVPEWATRMQIRAEWLNVFYEMKAGYGAYWVSVGENAGAGPTGATPSYSTEAFNWDAADNSGGYTTNWTVHQEIAVRPEWRGQTIPFAMRATKTASKTTYPGKVRLTSASGTVMQVRFMETAGAVDQ